MYMTINNDLVMFKAKTTVWDYPRILFEGPVEFTTTYGGVTQKETHTFCNAFHEVLCSDKLARAAARCGYVPCTKKLLKSNCLRCEVNEGQNEEENDTSTRLAEHYKKTNEECIKYLTDLGMERLHWRLWAAFMTVQFSVDVIVNKYVHCDNMSICETLV